MKKKWIILIVILVILIASRIALPFVVERVVNKKLGDIEGYDASISGIDINLYRGAYEIDSLIIVKAGDSIPEPFVFIREIDLSVHWKALFRGRIVAEVDFHEPDVNFAVSESPEGEKVTQDGTGVSWEEKFTELLPLKINKISIHNGKIAYMDFTSDPNVNIEITDLDLLFTNLSNIEKKDEKLPSHLKGSGNVYGNGKFEVEAGLYILQEIPDMDLNLKIENVQITKLNDFLNAYANVDAEAGIFNLYTEVIIDEAQLQGYIKPLMENLKIVKWKKEEEAFTVKVWESIVGTIAEAFENQPEDQFATRVPLEGNLNDVDTGIFPAIWNILKNAFVKAFEKELENTVGIKTEIGGGTGGELPL